MQYRRLLWGLAGCLVLLPAMASAQPLKPQEQFNRAVELAKAGDHLQAVDAGLEVLERLPASERNRVHKLLGYSYKKLRNLPESWHHLTQYLTSSIKEDTAAVAWLQEVETSLVETVHVKVTFTCEPTDATLSLPSPLTCPLTWWFKPGKHLVRAESPGYRPRNVEVDIRERGDSGAREIRLAAIVPLKPSGGESAGRDGPVATIISETTKPGKPTRALEWALLGSGLALGATGAIFHGIGYAKNESLHSKYQNPTNYPVDEDAKSAYDKAYQGQVRPKEIASYVLYGVGGASVAAGVVIWLVRKPKSGGSAAERVQITPLSLTGGSGALMTWEF